MNFTAFPVNTTGLHWDFGDGKGTADNKITPKYQYDIPGTYIVSLTGYGANGISVISFDTIIVKGPFGKLYTPLYQAVLRLQIHYMQLPAMPDHIPGILETAQC